MLSQEQLECYRRMKPAERFRVASELTRSAWAFLQSLPEEECLRRLRIMWGQHVSSNRNLADAFGKLP